MISTPNNSCSVKYVYKRKIYVLGSVKTTIVLAVPAAFKVYYMYVFLELLAITHKD